jgi:MFS superfamily sulfate permease-like transporter
MAQTTDEKRWPVFRPLQGATLGGLGVDLAAGLTLATIAIPEQMATARLGGLAPQIGLFAFVAATLGFIAFGANRVLSAGADSTVAPIFAGTLATLAAVGSPLYGELAAVLALMVGILVTIAGVVRLGWIADLLSRPVLTGFLAGIALHIVLSQAPAALGLPEGAGPFYRQVAQLAAEVGRINWTAAGIALGVFAATFGAEKLSPRIPGALIGLAGATIAAAALGLGRLGVPLLGALPSGFPAPAIPRLHPESLAPLVGLAGIVALVVMVQTAAVTRSFSGGEADPDVDRDYLGVGVGNVLAGIFGAFPVNASPPRTAAVSEAGGRSQIGGLAAALAVLLLAAFGGRLLADTPTAALAGVLFFVAQRIFHFGDFAYLARRAPVEFGLAVLTVLLIVLLPIQTGVAIAVFFSLANGVFTITRARLIPFEPVAGTTVWWPTAPGTRVEPSAGVLVVGFQAPLSFLNAYTFRRDMERELASCAEVQLLVLEASSIVEIDFTASQILGEVIRKVRGEGIEFAISRLESVRAESALRRFGVMDLLGPGRLFHSVDEAIRTLAPRPPDGSDPAVHPAAP